jgi:hypothetical protein
LAFVSAAAASLRRKRFFLKKEAKTFCEFAYAVRQRETPIAKVFWFFFSKKNRFLPGVDRTARV